MGFVTRESEEAAGLSDFIHSAPTDSINRLRRPGRTDSSFGGDPNQSDLTFLSFLFPLPDLFTR